MKTKPKRNKPRLPEEARVRLRKGCAHKNKKRYNRKKLKLHSIDMLVRFLIFLILFKVLLRIWLFEYLI